MKRILILKQNPVLSIMKYEFEKFN
jgi:hypothetical protein